LTIWYCILGAELTKNALLQTVSFGDFAHWSCASWVGVLQFINISS